MLSPRPWKRFYDLAVVEDRATIALPGCAVVPWILRTLFAKANGLNLTRPDAGRKEEAAHRLCTTLPESQVVLTSAPLVTVALNHDASVSITAQNLCVKLQCSKITRL